MRILETKSIVDFLQKRNLLVMYKKAKKYLESHATAQVQLKKRNPKKENIWQFRINKKYRTFGYFKDKTTFIVFEINDHQ